MQQLDPLKPGGKSGKKNELDYCTFRCPVYYLGDLYGIPNSASGLTINAC